MTCNLMLVGFKLESNVDKETLIERAKIRMGTSKASLMVANTSDSLHVNSATH